jgi:type I restriction enzyme M protein
MNSEALVKKTSKIMYGDEGVSGTAQYLSQLVWILFLKVFDYKESEWELEDDYVPVIPEPYRFRDWADVEDADGNKDYKNRMTGDKLIEFVNNRLFPFLSGAEIEIDGRKHQFTSEDPKAYIVREFMAESSNYMKDGVNLRQVVNEIADIDFDNITDKHDFNEFYEKFLKELQNGGKATGEFYTPRAVTKFITDHVDPKLGEKVADFACGTGGFLAEAASHLQEQVTKIEDNTVIQQSLYGIEWKQLPYMLCMTNMFLHNLDNPNIVHGDGLAKNLLDLNDDDLFDCILMNPPFGGVVKKSNLGNFPNDISSSESADLFVARIIYCLKKNGRCGLVLPDGLFFNTDNSKVALKKKMLNECKLHTVIRLPHTVFAPYTDITTNLLFFDKVGRTDEVWFYRMDMPAGRKRFNKTHPITREDFNIVDEWWNNRIEIKDDKEDESLSETWKAKKISYKEIEERGFDIDICGFPDEEDIVLTPDETINNYIERRSILDKKMDEKLAKIKKLLEI